MENFLNFERRLHPRLKLTFPIRYRLKTKLGFSSSIAYDISEGGIGFLISEFIPKEGEILIELPLFYAKPLIVAQAKMVWIRKQAYCLRFQAGCKFTQIQDSTKQDINTFLKKHAVLK